MIRSIPQIGLMLLCSVAFGAQPGGSDAHPAAQIAELAGPVEVMALDADAWTPAKAGQALAAGDSVRAGKHGRALVRLGDDIKLRLGAGTTIVIQPPEESNGGQRGVALLLGSLFAKVTAPPGGECPFEVAGSNAVAGVRGTEFSSAVALDGTFRAEVTKGKVVVEGDGASVDLTPGQFSQVSDDQKPSAPAGDTGVKLSAWLEKRRQAVLARAPEICERWMTRLERLRARFEKLEQRAAEIDKRFGDLVAKARLARHARQRPALARIRERLVKLIKEAVRIRRFSRRLGARLRSRLVLLQHLAGEASAQGNLEPDLKAKLVAVARKAEQIAPVIRKLARGSVRGLLRRAGIERRILRGMKMRYRDFLRRPRRKLPR